MLGEEFAFREAGFGHGADDGIDHAFHRQIAIAIGLDADVDAIDHGAQPRGAGVPRDRQREACQHDFAKVSSVQYCFVKHEYSLVAVHIVVLLQIKRIQ